MLSRTADNLFWLSRYVERAEFSARILDATYRLASLPAAYGGRMNEWESALRTTGALAAFQGTHGAITEANVLDFLAFSPDNPSSIRNCFDQSRSNARAVRTALTIEMWSTINDAWLKLKSMRPSRMSREEIGRFLEWVKAVSLAFDGTAYRTMLRNDSYAFSRLGVFLERADNTARILDVKYHVLLPSEEKPGGSLDYFQWTSILRAVSALTAYHWVYKESLKPWLVADFLILNPEMPRSFAACYENVTRYLDQLATFYGRQGPSQRQARATLAKLGNHSIDEIFQGGLHEFIEAFLVENNRLGTAITEQYLH